jgi:hypothetical protein
MVMQADPGRDQRRKRELSAQEHCWTPPLRADYITRLMPLQANRQPHRPRESSCNLDVEQFHFDSWQPICRISILTKYLFTTDTNAFPTIILINRRAASRVLYNTPTRALTLVLSARGGRPVGGQTSSSHAITSTRCNFDPINTGGCPAPWFLRHLPTCSASHSFITMPLLS